MKKLISLVASTLLLAGCTLFNKDATTQQKAAEVYRLSRVAANTRHHAGPDCEAHGSTGVRDSLPRARQCHRPDELERGDVASGFHEPADLSTERPEGNPVDGQCSDAVR